MPDRKLGLAWWRDAKADPPPEERIVMTDLGPMGHFDGVWYDRHEWHFAEDPQPSVWCDPSPPGDDAPTLKDLRRAHDALLYASGNLDHGILTVVAPEECEASAARLRRAIEEAER